MSDPQDRVPPADAIFPEGQTLQTQHGSGTHPSEAAASAPAPSEHERSLTASSPVQVIAGYVIEGELGRGGMGVVYRARQKGLGRLVALKMILHADHAGMEDRQRFQREAESLARMRHENIVQIYEVGEHDGKPFISLEYVEGGSLDRHLGGTPLRAQDSAWLVEQLAGAIQAAHDAGIIHRDLKPANVLLALGTRKEADSANARASAQAQDSARGNSSQAASSLFQLAPKITDFGLAKKQDEGGLSVSGAVMGTPSYMAPEQAAGKGKEIDGRTDVYALGAILYECLTGRPPFRAATAMDTMMQVLKDEPVPVRSLQPATPQDLETICLKCLQKEPERRYGSARELAEDLGRFLRGEPVQARPVGRLERGWRWCRRNPALAAVTGFALVALLAAAILGVGFTFAYQESLAADRLRVAFDRAETYRLRAQENAARLALERGLTLCEQDEAGRGLLWLAHSLETAPAEAADLQRDIRASVARWHHMIHSLESALQHPGRSQILTFSPDGSLFATCNAGALQLWTSADGKPLGPALNHGSPIHAAAFSWDGQRLLTGGNDRTAKVWQVKTGRLISELLPHEDRVAAGVFSRDGLRIATGSEDGTARLWDSATGKRLDVPPMRHKRAVTALAFSPDGRTLLTGSRDYAAQLWDTSTGQPRSRPLAHQGWVRAVAFNPDGKTVATASEVNLVLQWDATAGEPYGPPLAHQNDVLCLAYSPDGSVLLSGSTDETARLWNAGTGKPLGHSLPHQGEVSAVAFDRGGRTIRTGSLNGTVRQWKADTGQPFGKSLPHAGLVMAVAFSPDGKTALTGSLDGTARLWDSASGQPLGEPLRHDQGVWSLAFSLDGKTIVTGTADGLVHVWEAQTHKLRHHLLGHTSLIWSMEFSRDGSQLVTHSVDHSARRWDVSAGKEIGKPLRHQERVLAATFSPDGKTMLTAGADGVAQLWDAATSQPRGKALQHSARIQSAILSPNGEIAVTACWDGFARRWDTATGQLLDPPLEHKGPVMTLAFARDGTILATGGMDGVARLWDASTGRPLCEPLRHQGMVWDVKFSPDSRLLLTGSVDGTARLWEVAGGKPWGPPLKHRGRVKRVAFSPDGKTILTSSGDHTARLWEQPAPLSGTAERITLWAQVITGMELDAAEGAVRVLDAETWQQRRRQLEALGGAPSP